MGDIYFYQPADGHGLPHDPFKAMIGPRPIGWISTIDRQGHVNLAPYSFFNAICDNPPMIAFASSGRKDSLRNIEETGSFVWNMATRPLADAMNRTSAPVAHGVDEFGLAGLATSPSRLVEAPRVADTPAAMECRCVKIVVLHDDQGRQTSHWLVIGQVVGVHIDQHYLKDGLFDTGAAHPILRAGYIADYAEIGPEAMFRMERPKA